MLSRENISTPVLLGRELWVINKAPLQLAVGPLFRWWTGQGKFEQTVLWRGRSFLFILSSPGDRLSPGKGTNGVNCSEAIRQIWLHHSPPWKPSRAPLLPSGSRPVPWYGLRGPSSPGFGGPLLPLALSSLPTSTLFSKFHNVWKVYSLRQEHHLYTLLCAGSKTLPVSSGDWICL